MKTPTLIQSSDPIALQFWVMNRWGIFAFNFLKFAVTNLFGQPRYLRNLDWQALICLSQDFK